MLGIDIGRHKERDGYGSNEHIFVVRYVGGGGTSQEVVAIDTKIVLGIYQ